MKITTSLLLAAAVAVFAVGCEDQPDGAKQPQNNQQPGQPPGQEPGQQEPGQPPGAPGGQAQQQPLFQPAPSDDRSNTQLPSRSPFSDSNREAGSALPSGGGVVPADGRTGLSTPQPESGETIQQSSGEEDAQADDESDRP